MSQSTAVPLDEEEAEDLVAEYVKETVPLVEMNTEEGVEKAVPLVEVDAEEPVTEWVKETVALSLRDIEVELFVSSDVVFWFEPLEVSSSSSSLSLLLSWTSFGLDVGGL